MDEATREARRAEAYRLAGLALLAARDAIEERQAEAEAEASLPSERRAS